MEVTKWYRMKPSGGIGKEPGGMLTPMRLTSRLR
jgi:hypothetical protein